MDRTEIIQLVKKYPALEQAIAKRISQDGVPKELCRLCDAPWEKRLSDKLDYHQSEIARKAVTFLRTYKVIEISKETDASGQDHISIKTAEEAPMLSRVLNLSGTRRARTKWGGLDLVPYYPVPLANAPRILRELGIHEVFEEFDGGIDSCPHLSFLTPEKELLQRAIRLAKQQHTREWIHPPEALHGLWGLDVRRTTTYLYFCCDRCRSDIERISCRFSPIAESHTGYQVGEHGYCKWRLALAVKLLREADPNISYVLGDWWCGFVFLDKARVLISVHPDAPAVGSRGRIHSKVVEFLKGGVDLIVIDEGRIYEYRHDREIESDINVLVRRIVTSLEGYRLMEQGNHHDRYVKALARIGRESGFLSLTEHRVKGSRLDCVWLDAEAEVFAAIEVETSGTFKKDIISTWESGPRMAVICINNETDSAIHTLAGYELLKVVPHALLVVNTATKNAYLFDKQEVIGRYELVLPSAANG